MKDMEAAREHNVEVGWGYRFDLELADYFHGKTMDIIEGRDPLDHVHSLEYGARIVNALEGGEPLEFYGNVPNRRRLLEDFPEFAIVEVPCIAPRSPARAW